MEKVDVDPARLAELEERLNLIHSLKRKYGASLAEVIAFGDEAKRKLQSLESRDAELDRLNAGLAKLDAEILKAGQSLSARRRKIIPQLAKSVGKQLADLGFRQSKFGVELKALTPSSATGKGPFEDYPFPPHPDPLLKGEGTAGVRPGFGDDRGVKSDVSNSASRRTIPPLLGERAGVRGLICHTTGFDEIEFQFAPNPGEPAKPLRAIASSGEMARVMLALKTVLAAEDEIPVLIFDEVDANVGGETANAVGEKDEADCGQAAGAVHHASAAGGRARGCALRRDQADQKRPDDFGNSIAGAKRARDRTGADAGRPERRGQETCRSIVEMKVKALPGRR